jgi:Tol biopolymer transport system component
MDTSETRIVDVAPGASDSSGIGEHPHISNDGEYVVFDSDATDLPGGDQNGATVDVFRKDVITGAVDLISQAPGGALGDSTADSLSGDGNVVAFSSAAPNLIPGDTNGTTDVFTRNLVTGAVVRVSTGADGSQLSGPSYAAAASGEGRWIAFASRAPDVMPGTAATARSRIYRKDVFTGAVDLVSAGVNLAPRTLIDAPIGKMAKRQARMVSGTAEDDGTVARVDVSLSRSIGKGRCLWLSRGSRVAKGRCAAPVWLAAKLDNGLRFTLAIRHVLSRGTWQLRTRATDQTGMGEPERAGRNSVTLKLL